MTTKHTYKVTLIQFVADGHKLEEITLQTHTHNTRRAAENHARALIAARKNHRYSDDYLAHITQHTTTNGHTETTAYADHTTDTPLTWTQLHTD